MNADGKNEMKRKEKTVFNAFRNKFFFFTKFIFFTMKNNSDFYSNLQFPKNNLDKTANVTKWIVAYKKQHKCQKIKKETSWTIAY